MDKAIVDILACPVCLGNPLGLEIMGKDSSEVIEGKLECRRCGRGYPIGEGIARMIPGSPGESEENLIAEKEAWEHRGIVEGNVLQRHREVREANVLYHDVAADVYEIDVEQSVHQNEFNQARIERIVRSLAQREGNNFFLDIGCGTGNVLKFAERYFERAVGVDVSIGLLKIAKDRGSEVIQADAAFLPFIPRVFSAASVFSVLHHLYDPLPILEEAERVLKGGGFIYADWDPQMMPVSRNTLSWRFMRLLARGVRSGLSRLHSREQASVSQGVEVVNFRELDPNIKEVYALAEYHNLCREVERGIDARAVKTILEDLDFSDIEMNFHWHGRSFDQLPVVERIALFVKSKLSGNPIERFMENFMIISQKGRREGFNG